VNAKSRETTAEMFYTVFIESTVPLHLSGRRVIEATIRHILKWYLTDESLKRNINHFIGFSFRLLDFLFILDIGTS
jgi:hypothetical protein